MHYSVLVVTDERPTTQSIEEALRPFRQEGSDEFLQDLDITEGVKERFLAASGTMLKSPDGTLHNAFDERFYREPMENEDHSITSGWMMMGARDGVRYDIKGWSDGGLAAKVRFVPEGWSEVMNPSGHNQTMAEFASKYHGISIVASEDDVERDGEHRNGFVLVDENGDVLKVIVRDNPHAHYDYYEKPGRFSGVLKHLGGADVCQRSSLRMEETAAEHESKRRKWAAEMVEALPINGHEELEQLLRNYKAARDEWSRIRSERQNWSDWLTARDPLLADLLARSAELPTLQPDESLEQWFTSAFPLWAYAIVADGVWHTREMTAWWRDISNDEARWAPIAWKLILDLPSDKWISVVDCHN
jgi:hypothetical protein